jgi:hypothetical protein
MNNFINKLPTKFQWTLHNVIAHPLMELLHLLGFTKLGNKIHDSTLPTPRNVTEIKTTNLE